MATTPQSSTTQPDSIENSDSSSAQRGTTTIPATVVAQVAAQAAFEFETVGSNAGGVLGIGSRRNFLVLRFQRLFRPPSRSCVHT